MTGDWQLDVDTRRCIGSGVCASAAPGRFVIDSAADGTRRSRPTAPRVPSDDAVLDAAFTCPVEAISVVELDSGLTLFPEGGEHH
ncbi:ferredoxin [Streptomyces sp. NBC_00536]|uniref:ferredoxin n=1 Tax=Streptomyces sp. NBC_00536 TaxID=2975769 RepID=UPI002E81A821|nr:ferredoxin [Streptomyces sp. NBC_00536]WUC82439.1 ferredoxin [Streptomyces sp. NBC_00536]